MARSRALAVEMSGAFRSACACRRVTHLPDLTPIDCALLTRAMPAADSGASSALSVACTAGVRMADMQKHGRKSQSLRRQLSRIRAPCGDRRLRRERARTSAHR